MKILFKAFNCWADKGEVAEPERHRRYAEYVSHIENPQAKKMFAELAKQCKRPRRSREEMRQLVPNRENQFKFKKAKLKKSRKKQHTMQVKFNQANMRKFRKQVEVKAVVRERFLRQVKVEAKVEVEVEVEVEV